MECLIDGLARFLASSFRLAVQPSTAGLLLEGRRISICLFLGEGAEVIGKVLFLTDCASLILIPSPKLG